MRAGRSAAIPVAVAILTVLAFLPALSAGFVTWDDNRNFLDNEAWRGLAPAQLRWMWTTFHMGHYVPLTWMTLGFDYELGGMDPTGYHLHNVVLHALNAMLVYALALRMLGGAFNTAAERTSLSLTVPAAFAALLFSVHPLRVESVAWITERRDVLSMAFCLISLLAYLRHAERNETPGRWYWTSLVVFAAALLSKATSMSLPAVMLVLNVYPLRRLGGDAGFGSRSARRVYAELVPFAALSAATAALSIVALDPPGQLGLPAKLAVSGYSLAFYVLKTVVPTNLAPLYEMPKTVDAMAARYLVSVAVAASLTIGAWIVRRRWPGVTAAWFAFLLMVLPMLGIVQNGPQIAADRYTYHAAPALALLGGGLLARWRPPMTVRAWVVGVPLLVLGLLTWRQALVWQTSERLWTRVLEVDPNSSVAEIAMGDLTIAEGRVDEAVRHYARGVELDPTFGAGFNNLGVALARQGNTAAAIEQFGKAIELDPDNAGAQVNIGNAIVRQGRPSDAIPHYSRAASLRPGDADTHLNWGVALAQSGDLGAAVAQFRRVLTLRPGDADARAYLDRAEELRARAR